MFVFLKLITQYFTFLDIFFFVYASIVLYYPSRFFILSLTMDQAENASIHSFVVFIVTWTNGRTWKNEWMESMGWYVNATKRIKMAYEIYLIKNTINYTLSIVISRVDMTCHGIARILISLESFCTDRLGGWIKYSLNMSDLFSLLCKLL